MGRGGAAAYRVGGDGSLTPAGGSVLNGGTDTCWFIVSDDRHHGYTTSFFEDGRLSVYRTSPGGGLGLQDADVSDAVTRGASDITLNRNSKWLYQLNSFEGTINNFRVEANGGLTLVQTVKATGPSMMSGRLGIAAS